MALGFKRTNQSQREDQYLLGLGLFMRKDANGRTWLGPTIDVTTCGADGDTSVDQADAFQEAHDRLPADGGMIVVPQVPSYYKFETQVDFTKPVILYGSGQFCSELVTTTNALKMIRTTKKILMYNMGVTASGAAVGTARGVTILSTATDHSDSLFFHCYFQGFDICLHAERTTSLHVSRCRFSPSSGYGLYLENQTNPDEGDSFIGSNYFASGTGDTSIYVLSTSGINICSNKFNGGVDAHIDILPTTNDVGNFLIQNNSFEGMVTHGIRAVATTGSIEKTIIVGNQFSGAAATCIEIGKNARQNVITGNTFNNTVSSSGIGVYLRDDSQNSTVRDNHFYTMLTAIKSDTKITGQNIGGNRYALVNNSTLEVTNFYLGGEVDTSLDGPGSSKEFEIERYISNSSDSAYVDAFKLKGDCILETWVTGTVQGVGNARKYRKDMIYGDTSSSALISTVSAGSSFDLRVASSGGSTVVGIKRATGVGTSVTMQVRVKVNGHVVDFAKA